MSWWCSASVSEGREPWLREGSASAVLPNGAGSSTLGTQTAARNFLRSYLPDT